MLFHAQNKIICILQLAHYFNVQELLKKNQFYKQTSNFEWPKGHTLFQINTFKKH